jgi:hypothetical protein
MAIHDKQKYKDLLCIDPSQNQNKLFKQDMCNDSLNIENGARIAY